MSQKPEHKFPPHRSSYADFDLRVTTVIELGHELVREFMKE